jgi:hypothetical protein
MPGRLEGLPAIKLVSTTHVLSILHLCSLVRIKHSVWQAMQWLCGHHDVPRAHFGHKVNLPRLADCAQHKANALVTAITAYTGQQSVPACHMR